MFFHYRSRNPYSRLYLTYEGSKPQWFLEVHNELDIVCILPMRDRNKKAALYYHRARSVCILPMRDRNKEEGIKRKQQLQVCILPMRDRNIKKIKTSQSVLNMFVSYL